MIAAKFTRTKVGSMTLGERFRKIRSDRRISLSEVSRATKIRVKYLEAIEEGAYDRLPAEVYVKGFLKSYAGHLGVPEEAILKLYERERHIQKNLGRVGNDSVHPSAPVRFSVVPSPRVLAGTIGFLVAIGFFSYLYLELRSFVSEPRLVIEAPADGETVEGSEAVVSGKTDPRAEVRINGEETVVDENGTFVERITLTSGLNVISVSSMNRFGKTREREISVNASVPDTDVSAESGPFPDAPVDETIRLAVRVGADTVLSVTADGEVVWNGRASAGEERSFSASETIEVSADSGEAVTVRFGGGAEETLSAVTGAASVAFGPEGRIGPGEESPERETGREQDGSANTE